MNKTTPSQDRYGKRNEKLRVAPKCSRCGETKNPEDFYKTEVAYWCRSCRKVYAQQLYHKRREKMSAAEIEQLNDRLYARKKELYKKKIGAMTPKELAAFRSGINSKGKNQRDSVKNEVYLAYGGYKCACCGESEPGFLSIDHVNNDGAKHKKENRIRTGEQMYRWLKRNGYPSGFQILCMNCNWGKRSNKGVCPHIGKV